VPHQRPEPSHKPALKFGTGLPGDPKDLTGQEDFNDAEEMSEEEKAEEVKELPLAEDSSLMQFDNA
jgi:hypothetical protein